eukprot:6208851-Pleurochrysis_carterae.AAC.1
MRASICQCVRERVLIDTEPLGVGALARALAQVDMLEGLKGVPLKLLAYEHFLLRYPHRARRCARGRGACVREFGRHARVRAAPTRMRTHARARSHAFACARTF